MNLQDGLSLGEYLRQERERRNISIEQVASATKISVKILLSVESDQYMDLPAKPFVRGFVISYCRFLGLNSGEILGQYDRFLDERFGNRKAREDKYTGYAFEKRDRDWGKTALVGVMMGFVVIGGVLILILKPTFHHKNPAQLEQLQVAHEQIKQKEEALKSTGFVAQGPQLPDPAAVIPQQQPATSTKAAPESAKPALPVSEPQNQTEEARGPTSEEDKDPMQKGDSLKPEEVREKVVLKALADTYVRYKVDGLEVKTMMLRAEKLLVLKGKEKVVFQVSNPKAIEIRPKGSAAYRGLAGFTDMFNINEQPTVIFPTSKKDESKNLLSDFKALPATEGPN